MKKIVALLLIAVLLLGLTACGNNESSNSGSQDKNPATDIQETSSFTLLYCENDTMNPYKTISKLNAELGSLLFDPLFTVDNSFNAKEVLAADITSQEKVHTVKLKDALFSDGSPLTAADVIYSYELAKASDRYSFLFYEVISIEATDDKTVVFTLDRYDNYFKNLLYFPIIKSGSDQLKNEDNVELPPIGTGRFVFADKAEKLVPNQNRFEKISNISEISLINAPDDESMAHYVEVGATDIYYADRGDDAIIRMSGHKSTVNMPNLVYLGINHNYGPLKSEYLRYAISSAISRERLVKAAFYTNAICADGFYHPEFEETAGYQTIQSSANLKISVENLANIGYNSMNEEGFLVNSKGSALELTLLVNSQNQSKMTAASLISQQLAEAGIKLTVDSVDETTYFARLRDGQYQLYLGEVKLLPNMDMSSLVLSGGSAAYGIISDVVTSSPEDEQPEVQTYFSPETSYISVVKGLYQGTNSTIDAASALLSSMPIIPLLWRNSIVFYSDEISDIGEASAYDIFLSADSYKFKK